ncbi:MAG: hypothetical protein J0M04_14650 [Verrucomicrobia bacterium]|nr:hypothetical protein [Verrucomicrobiota bacterium]
MRIKSPQTPIASGELQESAPVDYVTWTEQVAGFAGRLSGVAAAGPTAFGWTVSVIPYPSR